jgi:plasmid stability protein
MTLTIEIPDDLEAALKTQAEAEGVSAEQYARRVLEQDLKSGSGPRRHISEVIRENMRDVPAEVLAQLPGDGASEHDRYSYGLPKRNR